VRNTDLYTRTGERVESRWFEAGLEEPDLLPSLLLGSAAGLVRRGPAVIGRGIERLFGRRAARAGARSLGDAADELAFQPSVTIGPSPTPPPSPRPTVPLPHAGERGLDYGTRVHLEYPRIIRETNPGATGEFNVLPGQTGPDLANPVGMNATYGELKSLWDRQTRILQQARNWGLDPSTARYHFYDRHTGLVFEGVIQTDKLPSGAFIP
jgi:hypothetical protein